MSREGELRWPRFCDKDIFLPPLHVAGEWLTVSLPWIHGSCYSTSFPLYLADPETSGGKADLSSGVLVSKTAATHYKEVQCI
jgi:hypothetical protein